MALNLSGTSGITGAGIGTIGPSGANITGVGTFTQVEIDDKIIHVGDTNTAIRFPTADKVSVETGGTEALNVDSSQRVNIGGVAVSQSRTVNIASNAEANLAIETHNTSASETANIRFYRSRGTGASPTTLVDNDVISNMLFYAHDGTDYANIGATIRVECDGTIASNSTPTAMSFQTNGGATSATERLRIDSSGNVTKPTNFHILVARDGNQTGYNASNMSDVVIWNSVITGESSTGAADHFNTSTGLFTAPVTGMYHFHVSVNCDYSVEGGWINVNGSRPNYAAFYPNNAASADGHLTYHITAGETVGIKWYDNGNTSTTINANTHHTWWRIVLLG